MNPLNTVAGDGQNVDIFHLTCVVNPAFSVAFLAGKIKQLVLVKVSALVFVSIKQYVREIFWKPAKSEPPDNIRRPALLALLMDCQYLQLFDAVEEGFSSGPFESDYHRMNISYILEMFS